MKYPKTFTVKEWQRFNKVIDQIPFNPDTNRPYQFYNFHNKRYEDYDYMTVQEVALNKFDITLINYKVNPLLNYKDLNKKDLVVKIAKNFNMSNFNKGMKIFNDGVKGFTNSIDTVTSQLGDGSKNKDFILPKKKTNQIKLWSEKKQSKKYKSNSNNLKIWSDHPKKKTRRRKSVQTRSNTWDNHERNMEKIWGKK